MIALQQFRRTGTTLSLKIQAQFYCKISKKQEYRKCYQTLEVPEDSDQAQIRASYLLLVKKYHPDNPDGGNLEKFHEVDRAFRILIQKHSRERWDVEDDYQMTEREEFDIKHTAPQHRQYLSYGGVGSGTPFQREKQYLKMRAMQATENVLQHRIAKVTAGEKAVMDKKLPFKHKIKTKYGFDRLVEDLIQESMSKGDFNNLAGCGKPLKEHQNLNPYVDYVTHKMNQVLIDNGFTPEWITLQKEIREEVDMLKRGLANERLYFGSLPLSPDDDSDWLEIVEKYKTITQQINKKINKFNLIVPVLNKQMVQVNLDRVAEGILVNGDRNSERRTNRNPIKSEISDSESEHIVGNLFGLFDGIFKKS